VKAPDGGSDAPVLPAVDCDVLYGTRSIALWMGMTCAQARPLIEDGTIPTYSAARTDNPMCAQVGNQCGVGGIRCKRARQVSLSG